MKYTLLDMTQTILYSLTGDEISSINDTYESKQIVRLIRTAYYDIIERAKLPEEKSLFEVTEAGASYPVMMTIPDVVRKIDWIKYDQQTATDTDTQYREVFFKPFDLFIQDSYALSESDTNVDLMTVTLDNATFDVLYMNNQFPSYYTVYEETTLLFDSYDSTTDTTGLQTDKTICFGELAPEFSLADSFTPALDDDQFPLLLAESKALAWAELKQAQNIKAEQSAKRNWSAQAINKHRADPRSAYEKIKGYGRK